MPNPASKFTVTVSTMPGPWAKLEGSGGKSETQRVREAGGAPKTPIEGEYEASDITVTRFYDAARDGDLRAQLEAGNFRPYNGATITEVAFDSAGLPIGRPQPMPGCVIQSWELSGTDANDEKLRELSIVWAVSVR